MVMTQPKLAGLDDGPPMPKRKVRKMGAKSKRGGHRAERTTPIVATLQHTDLVDGTPTSVVLVIDDVLTKNERHRIGQIKVKGKKVGRLLPSEKAENFRASVREANDRVGLRIESGVWCINVLAVWPTERHLDMDFAHGDADASISATMDALQHAGIIDNDVRIVWAQGHSVHRKGMRCTIAQLTRCDIGVRDAEIAHLVAVLPPPAASAVAPVASKRRKR